MGVLYISKYFNLPSVFINMEPFHALIEDSLALRKLLDVYIELRKHFQELGFSESDLDEPPTYTPTMMNLHDKFSSRLKSLQQTISDYGFDVSKEEVVGYVKPLLMKINELTPLKDGNYKGNDSGDENN